MALVLALVRSEQVRQRSRSSVDPCFSKDILEVPLDCFDAKIATGRNFLLGAGSVLFRGHVGGLQASSGATIRLLIFHHPDLTALPASGCAPMAATNVARANNLLTPQCGSAVGKAEFTIP